MASLPPYYTDSSLTVCIKNLREICSDPADPPVSDATIKAQLFENNQVDPIGSEITVDPIAGKPGEYKGVIAAQPSITKAFENIFVKIIVEKTGVFKTVIWSPRSVRDRRL